MISWLRFEMTFKQNIVFGVVFSVLYFLLFILQANALYRPYDIYRPGARAMGAGGTGTANPDSVAALSQNPSYLAEMAEPSVAFGLDAFTRIQRVQTNVRVQPQYIPLIIAGFPLLPNAGTGIMIQAPFERRFPDANYVVYVIEAMYAQSVTRRLSLGVTAGGSVGIQADLFAGVGASYSFSALYRAHFADFGLYIRPGIKLVFDTFSTGNRLEERTPDIVKGGISKEFTWVRVTAEAEYLNWEGSYYIEAGKDETPAFAPGLFGRIHPRIGFDFPIRSWPGLMFRTGLLTEDAFDFAGKNERQILFTLGVGGLAGSDIWGERLRLDFSVASSFIPSLFWDEANQIEKIQATIEFIY